MSAADNRFESRSMRMLSLLAAVMPDVRAQTTPVYDVFDLGCVSEALAESIINELRTLPAAA